MSIKRINEFPEGSGSLSNDDVFLFMDNPSGSGITKKISLSQIASAIGGGGGGGNADTGDITFDSIKIIGSGTGSGDGNNKGTIELVPDNTLYNNNQYLIVDPTAPNHIHLRAGGTQDSSNAELILGGEQANIKVTDYNHQVNINSAYTNVQNINARSVNGAGYTGYIIVPLNSNVPVGSKLVIEGVEYTVIESINNLFDESVDGLVVSPELVGGSPPNLEFDLNRFVDIVYPTVNHNWTFNNQGDLEIPGNILLNNGTSVAKGTFDNGTSGQNGVSLNCAVGYELNWQGGRLKSTSDGGTTASPIYVDSPMSISPVTVEVGYSSTITVDAKYGDMFDITLTGNTTIDNPTNPINGKTIRWRISQDSTGNRTVTLGNKFNLPSSASSTLPWSTGVNKMDVLAATYHAGRDKWDITAFVPGY